MKRHKAAFILSFIYCGLGQIYKGQNLKGFSFIIGYTLLIVSLFFRPYFLSIVHFTVLFLIILMWFMGVVDAYIDDEDPVGVEQSFLWRKLEPILEIAVICVALMAIIVVTYPGFDNMPVIQNPLAREIANKIESKTESSTGLTEIFSIQVAAFKDYGRAVELYDFITSKGYPVKIDYQTSSVDRLYRILVGNFKTEEEARSFADKVNKRIGINYIIVRRPANP